MIKVDELGRQWPPHFPAGCPPAAATVVDEALFRIVAHDPPKPDDFRSYLEMGLREAEDPCKRAGLSAYGTQFQAKRKMEQLSRNSPLVRDFFVACATLTPAQGAVSKAGSRGHRTLWLSAAALATAPEQFRVPL